MKTKRNKKIVTYKRKKNKKLNRQSLKHNNKFTRKIIQKGGEWIQPLFYIYGNDEISLDNCRITDYNP